MSKSEPKAMKIAHIILVHNKPDQLHRLLMAIAHPDVVSFIHIDKKCRMDDFSFLTKLDNVVTVSKRIDVTWGGFSIVRAIVTSINEISRHTSTFDYVNLISGQDYPLKSPKAILDYLYQHPGRIFMDYFLPGHRWLEDLNIKLFRYHLTDYKFKGSTRLEQYLSKILPSISIPKDFVLVGNSGWFTLDWESASYVLNFFKHNRSFIRKFKLSWGSDEYLIQSILYNSPLRSKIVNDNLRLINWKEGNASPSIFTFEDEAKLLNSTKLFGRKFDLHVDERIFDSLDTAIEINK